jgi:hypothetical protein
VWRSPGARCFPRRPSMHRGRRGTRGAPWRYVNTTLHVTLHVNENNGGEGVGVWGVGITSQMLSIKFAVPVY